MVSAHDSGERPKPSCKSADTGKCVASTISLALASTPSRVIEVLESTRPALKAYPALVVASASKPSAVRIFAEPAFHGFGIRKIPARSCNIRKALYFSSRVGIMHLDLELRNCPTASFLV